MLRYLKIAEAPSFIVDIATNLTDLQSPLQQHYKTWKYEMCLTTNQYNDFRLLEPRILGALYVLWDPKFAWNTVWSDTALIEIATPLQNRVAQVCWYGEAISSTLPASN